MRPGMDPNRQCFGDGYSTSETPLRCIFGIHENHIRAGLFCFTLSDTDKHTSGHVSYAFGQIMTFLHVCGCQIFKGDMNPNRFFCLQIILLQGRIRIIFNRKGDIPLPGTRTPYCTCIDPFPLSDGAEQPCHIPNF